MNNLYVFELNKRIGTGVSVVIAESEKEALEMVEEEWWQPFEWELTSTFVDIKKDKKVVVSVVSVE